MNGKVVRVVRQRGKMNRYRVIDLTNEEKAKACVGCVSLHIGVNVDHNHCDKTREDWNWMQQRVNGRWEGRCHYMQQALKEG